MSETGKYVIAALVVICFVLGFGWYSSCSAQKSECDKNGNILRGFYDSQEKESGKVWICTGKTSHAYHSTPECNGILSCRAEKKEVSLEEAIAMGRKPCHYCHKDVSTKNTLSKDALYYVCTDDDNDGYYHSTPACEILDECNNEIEEVTYADVELNNREPCPNCIR